MQFILCSSVKTPWASNWQNNNQLYPKLDKLNYCFMAKSNAGTHCVNKINFEYCSKSKTLWTLLPVLFRSASASEIFHPCNACRHMFWRHGIWKYGIETAGQMYLSTSPSLYKWFQSCQDLKNLLVITCLPPGCAVDDNWLLGHSLTATFLHGSQETLHRLINHEWVYGRRFRQ
jgi:hypothetical protein